MRSWSCRCAGALAGRIVAAATPCSSAPRTDSGLADRNSCAPNGLMYGPVGAPDVNVAREIDRPWCWIELNTRRPVSEDLRENRTTSTRGALGRTQFKEIEGQ